MKCRWCHTDAKSCFFAARTTPSDIVFLMSIASISAQLQCACRAFDYDIWCQCEFLPKSTFQIWRSSIVWTMTQVDDWFCALWPINDYISKSPRFNWFFSCQEDVLDNHIISMLRVRRNNRKWYSSASEILNFEPPAINSRWISWQISFVVAMTLLQVPGSRPKWISNDSGQRSSGNL